jgi:hypothetical protein
MRRLLRRSVGTSRTRWLRLLAGAGLMLGLAVPAAARVDGQGYSRSRARASEADGSTAPPKCSYAFYDASTDARDPFTGQQENQLDEVQGTLGLSSNHKRLRVVMSFKNLSKKIPTGSNFNSYDFYWTNPSGDTGPNAVEVQVSNSAAVTYSDGTESTVSGNFQYTPSSSSAATGKFGSGAGGKIEVDVPLSELKLKVGKVLAKPSAYAATGANGQVTSVGSVVDQDGPGHSYKLGQPTCIDPERG